jgi:hypothetical protein
MMYELCGWQVCSELPIPELMPWNGDSGVPDVLFRVGTVPPALDAPVHSGPFAESDASGMILVRIAAVARYLIKNRGVVIIEPASGASENDVRAFLLGSVLGLLCHMRGLLPLHASCLKVDGRAIALVGHSGEGKSTTAAALSAAGHGLLADDVTALEISASSVLVRPTFPRLKLWSDSLSATRLLSDDLSAARTGQGKFQLYRPENFSAKPIALSGIYQLESNPRYTDPKIEEVRGAEAVNSVYPHIYRRRLGEMAAGHSSLFIAIAQLMRQIPYFKLTRRRELSELDRLVATIVCHSASFA